MPSSIAVSDVLGVWDEEVAGEERGAHSDRGHASDEDEGEEATPRASPQTPYSFSPTPSTQVLSRLPTTSPPLGATSSIPSHSHFESQLDASRSELHPTSEQLSDHLPSGPLTDVATDLPDLDLESSDESLPPSPLLLRPAPPFPRDVPAPIKGFHVSSDGGLQALTARAAALRPISNAVQCFTGSPRRQRIPTYADDEVRAFRVGDKRWWTVHANHTTNLASADE
jgi:hypothetical protein